MKHTTLEAKIADWFAMSEETWQRHANPWSVWTRMTTLPLIILAIWSRIWIGRYSLVSVAVALAWTWFNPRLFAKSRSTRNWASKAVLGERVWLNRNNVPVPEHHRTLPSLLNGVQVIGFGFLSWGLWRLRKWPTLVGLILMMGAKLWFVDRMVWLYEEMKETEPTYEGWLY